MHSEHESVGTLKQQSPPSKLQTALFVISSQTPSPTNEMLLHPSTMNGGNSKMNKTGHAFHSYAAGKGRVYCNAKNAEQYLEYIAMLGILSHAGKF